MDRGLLEPSLFSMQTFCFQKIKDMRTNSKGKYWHAQMHNNQANYIVEILYVPNMDVFHQHMRITLMHTDGQDTRERVHERYKPTSLHKN